jgi:hypothetical protein
MMQMHIPDEELIQSMDGELEERRAGEVREHVSHCWRCRARQAELERAVGEFVGLHRETLDPRIPPVEGPAARLRASLAELAPKAPRRLLRVWMPLAWSAGAIAATIGVVFWITEQRASAGYLPDSRLTPGATRFISREQVCAVPAVDDDRPVSMELASRVFEEYRIQPLPRAYEVDYLITPALGGADDIRNLWPQPYESGLWTARVKDALEDHLRSLVCEGRVDLATAQHEIATDWIAAYRKYFRTSRPIPAHALFVKDRPWE